MSGPVSIPDLPSIRPPKRFDVDERRFPLAARAIRELDDPMGQELRVMLDELRPPRAHRTQVHVPAELLRMDGDAEAAIPVLLEDVSETGVLVTVPRHVDLDVEDICFARLRIKSSLGDETLVLDARLARFVDIDDEGVTFGYQLQVAPEVRRALPYHFARWKRQKSA